MCVQQDRRKWGKNEIEFWLVRLKKINLRAEYLGTEGGILLQKFKELYWRISRQRW
jgi:hypothetical protein